MTRLLFVALAVSLSSSAFAQETDEEGRQIKYKERTEIDFEGVDVTGELVKPQGQLLLDANGPAPSAEPVATGTVITKEFLEHIPVGRSYQSAVQMAPGVAGGGKGGRRDKALEREEDEESEPDTLGGAATVEMSYRRRRGLHIDLPERPSPEEREAQQAERRADRFDRAEAREVERVARRAARGPEVEHTTIELSMGADDEPPDVKATTLDVIVPSHGEAVLHQRLLVPAGAEQRLLIDARRTRSRRTP